MTAKRIDGKATAADLRAAVALEVDELEEKHRFTPGLAVVLVGEDPASQVYVGAKHKATLEVGMKSFEHRLPADTSEAKLLDLVQQLNSRDDVDGILVQLPLPKHVDATRILDAIDPKKDVDGFHALNAGLLAAGRAALVPCTPVGAMRLIRQTLPHIAGLHAVIVGRSNIVGKPMAQLLLAADCTVTIAHSKTRGLPAIVRQADIVVAAVGRPEMIRGDWIKPGATVIDVGINRLPGADGSKGRLVGDVAFAEAEKVAGAITPVPGGVGPMTIACLLANTIQAAKARRGLS
ncbi:MAG: bifunctional methylenetetrahydrofolate dehydrogenase/methenyltetrahydrofolate cyclohydrolase FolD [Alphaproteobacteria bacterium]|nr:bifunctional methylenetetrahydrofolate dehydrogenase/methenyltetrahydrofolate cyclohydrolase FolD [Alphaproteobacteria bacterium]